jgi:hypothetical protein
MKHVDPPTVITDKVTGQILELSKPGSDSLDHQRRITENLDLSSHLATTHLTLLMRCG